jgi:hypothetical protein
MKIINISAYKIILLETEKTRNGFRHKATFVDNGKENVSVKINYLNRTWERFEYESVIKKLLKEIDLTDLEKARVLERTQ